MTDDLHQAAEALIINEGALLDQRQWDQWLDLYTEDAEYWVPAWDDEYTLTNDPETEISLIYYANRSGLDDRVFRLKTERSLASTPLPRTCHMNTNFRVATEANGELTVHSAWHTYAYKLKVSSQFFGHQTHLIRPTASGLKIAARKIIVLNDLIPNVLDIYSI
ncbi:MAG: benzoate 1,2-dioxygenase small subunit [Pseudomonadales bacterium]|nr:benzoate 1,2-dioxygenase small subunit [Pseudomonadales bacterium]